jgi:hypothetical protein
MPPTRVTTPALALAFLASLLNAAPPATQPAPSPRLTEIVTTAVRSLQSAHPDYNLKDDQIAVTLVDLSPNPQSETRNPQWGHFRGDQLIYPASVVKLFYLAHAHHLLSTGELRDTPELRRGLEEMIVNSDNDATAYILYAITDAPNGVELPEPEMAAWSHKRNAVNRYFASLGYPKINACQCPYSFGPFGRERIFLGEKYTNRNMLSTNATSLLMYQIATRQFVSPKASDDMLALLERKRATTKPSDPDDQTNGFTGLSLPPGWKLFSKAGWTSTARHDTAYLESPDGQTKLVLTTFTTGHAKRRDLIPSVLTSVLSQLRPTRE